MNFLWAFDAEQRSPAAIARGYFSIFSTNQPELLYASKKKIKNPTTNNQRPTTKHIKYNVKLSHVCVCVCGSNIKSTHSA